MKPALFLLFAASLAFAADAAKPAATTPTEPAAKAAKRAAAAGGAQRQAVVPDAVDGVAKEELAKIKVAALKAYQEESVKAARERMAEVRTR